MIILSSVENSDKKLVILGPPGVGKSSVLLSIFGSVDPELILASPSEPTRGIDVAVYRYGHVNIGVHDFSGQELMYLLSNEQDFIFPGTDELLVVFEYGMNKKKIVSFLKNISMIIRKFQIPYYYLLIHKVDKAKSKREEEEYIQDLQVLVDKTFGMDKIRIFGTSLYPEYIGKFKFQMDWILTALEISLRNIKELKAVPVSEALLRSLRTSGYVGIDLDDESLVEPPEIDPHGYNEMKTIKNERDILELEREKE